MALFRASALPLALILSKVIGTQSQSKGAPIMLASSPLAQYSRGASVMAFAADSVADSCSNVDFGAKVADSCCEGTAMATVPVEQAYGGFTCLAQNPGFMDNEGVAVYFNCPAEGGELDVAAVCHMKLDSDTYDTGAGGKWGADYPLRNFGDNTTMVGKLITAEECGCVWKYQTQGAGCYRQMDLSMYPNIPAGPMMRWFLKFTGCGESLRVTEPVYTPEVTIASGPLAQVTRNAHVIAFPASAKPDSCKTPDFGAKLPDSCCEGTPIASTYVEDGWGSNTCFAQNPGFSDNAGVAIYMNCPAEGGDLDIAAVCAMKHANVTYATGGGSKWGADYPLFNFGPPGTMEGQLVTAEECGCVWKYQTQGPGCYRQMDLSMYPTIPQMAGVVWFLKFTGCGSTCGDIKQAYKASNCCNNPTKTFEMSSSRRLKVADEDNVVNMVKETYQKLHRSGDLAKANWLAKEVQKVLVTES